MLTSFRFSSQVKNFLVPACVQAVTAQVAMLRLMFSQHDIDLGKCRQCLQINLLIRQRRTSHHGREIVDLQDIIAVAKQLKKPLQIQPFMERSLDRPVIQIEAIDVDDCAFCISEQAGGVEFEPCLPKLLGRSCRIFN